MVLTLFAEKKITAKDLAIVCHYCDKAHVQGADFKPYGLAPGQSSDGAYQRYLDRSIPPRGPLYILDIPSTMKGRGKRTAQPIPTSPLQEYIAEEIREDGTILTRAAATEWPPCYHDNPVVIKAKAEGRPLPLPIVLYLDGVRFTAPLAGRSDSILGIWAFNAVTENRHLLVTLRTRDFCRCGCRGWCSLFPVMLMLRWGIAALACGQRPTRRHDHLEFDPLDPVLTATEDLGVDFGFTAVVMWLKGDWGEVSHSLALPSVSCYHCPCPFCTLTQPRLHSCYRTMVMPPRTQTYEAVCQSREVVVQITNEVDRAAVLACLVFDRKKNGRGRIMSAPLVVGGQALMSGDRLDPSEQLTDVMLLDEQPLPIVATFWRARSDFAGRITDPVMHRNPLFADDLGTSPQAIVAVDSLHSVYYGPMMRWSSATLWRVLLSNPWNLPGPDGQVLDLGTRRLRAHMFTWFEQQNIPHDRRIGDLTLTMLGSREHCTVGGERPHPGTILKTKAAETGIIFEWAMALVQSDLGRLVPHQGELIRSGANLQRWMDITRTSTLVLTPALSQELRDCSQRHLMHSSRALIHFIPKHHFFGHLSERAWWQGNPRCYSCFKDEGNNLTLRDTAAACHRTRQSERIFTSMGLLGALRPELGLFGPRVYFMP